MNDSETVIVICFIVLTLSSSFMAYWKGKADGYNSAIDSYYRGLTDCNECILKVFKEGEK